MARPSFPIDQIPAAPPRGLPSLGMPDDGAAAVDDTPADTPAEENIQAAPAARAQPRTQQQAVPKDEAAAGAAEENELAQFLAGMENETRKRRSESRLAQQKRDLELRAKRVEDLEKLDDELQKDPLGIMAKRGVGWDRLAQAKLDAKNPPVAKTAEQLRIDKLEAMLADRDRREREAVEKEPQRLQQEAQEYLSNWTNETVAKVKKLDEKAFEHIHSVPNGGQLVAALMLDQFQKTGQQVEMEDAAKVVEADLAKTIPGQLEMLLKNPVWRRTARAILAKDEPAKPKLQTPPPLRTRTAAQYPDDRQPAPATTPARNGTRETAHTRWEELAAKNGLG